MSVVTTRSSKASDYSKGFWKPWAWNDLMGLIKAAVLKAGELGENRQAGEASDRRQERTVHRAKL